MFLHIIALFNDTSFLPFVQLQHILVDVFCLIFRESTDLCHQYYIVGCCLLLLRKLVHNFKNFRAHSRNLLLPNFLLTKSCLDVHSLACV